MRWRIAIPVVLIAATVLPAWAGSASFDWDRWAALVNEQPCKLLDAGELAAIVGAGAVAESSVTAAESRCSWRSADGKLLLLSVTIASAPSAVAVRNERQGQLRDIETGRFERLPTPGGVVTAIFRKDRLRVTLFPNSDAEAAALHISGHPVLREDVAEREQRRERLLAFTQALMRRYGL